MDGRSRGRGCHVGGADGGVGWTERPGAAEVQAASNGSAVRRLRAARVRHGPRVEPAAATTIIVSAWVTDEEQALARATRLRARRRRPRQVQHRPHPRRQRRGRRQAENAAKEALRKTRGRQGQAPRSRLRPRAARGLLREQRRPLHLDRGQRPTASPTPARTAYVYNGPTLHGRVLRRRRATAWAAGTLDDYTDTDVNPDYYQYHYASSGSATRATAGPDPASIKVASANGDVDTIAAKEWIAKNPPGLRRGLQARLRHALLQRRRRRIQKMRDLATEFPNISDAIKLPSRRTATSARPRRCSALNTDADAPTRLRRTCARTPSNLPVAGSAPAHRHGRSAHGRADLEGLRATSAATA